MDARQQVALAPLLANQGGIEAAAHRGAFHFQRGQRAFDVVRLDLQHGGDVDRPHRATRTQATAHELTQRLFAARGDLRTGRHIDAGRGRGGRMHRLQLRQALGGGP